MLTKDPWRSAWRSAWRSVTFCIFHNEVWLLSCKEDKKRWQLQSLQKLDISDFPSISIFFSNNFDTTCTPTHMWLPTVVVLFVCWTFHMLLDLIQGVRVEVIMTRWWHGREDLKACFFFKDVHRCLICCTLCTVVCSCNNVEFYNNNYCFLSCSPSQVLHWISLCESVDRGHYWSDGKAS